MRRKRVFTRGRAVSIVVAGALGYLIGGWNAAALRGNTDLSAAQSIALRFPQDLEDAIPAATAALAAATSGSMMANAQAALLSPEPMTPQPAVSQPAAAPAPASVPMRMASAVAGSIRAVLPEKGAQQQRQAPAAAQQTPEAKAVAAAAAAKHHAERQGFVLNDAQIASIKQRLHLSEDQEQMWPAVEAALRNIAYARAREAKRQGTGAIGATTTTRVAGIDPNSVEVQGLKDAAVPLIMSFSSEQRDEVRSIAHVMGLDQLASQF